MHSRADAEDIAKARKQGIKFAFTWAPVKVEGKNGKLALSCRHDLELLPPQCLDYPDFKADEIRSIEADSVIMAVGQERDSQLTQLVGDVTLDPVTLQLGDKAIFAAGDMEHGLRPPYTLWLPDVAQLPRSSVSWLVRTCSMAVSTPVLM